MSCALLSWQHLSHLFSRVFINDKCAIYAPISVFSPKNTGGMTVSELCVKYGLPLALASYDTLCFWKDHVRVFQGRDTTNCNSSYTAGRRVRHCLSLWPCAAAWNHHLWGFESRPSHVSRQCNVFLLVTSTATTSSPFTRRRVSSDACTLLRDA